MLEPRPSAVDTDRNLLFGVLALQSALIDNNQFAEICAAWVTRKQVPLAQLLRERGWVTAEEQQEIERGVQRHLKQHGGDVRKSLGAVADAGVRDLIRATGDSDLRKSLSSLPPAAGYVMLQTIDQTVDVPPRERSRYSLTRLHAEGGLGRVYVARDNDVGREVALKEIKPEQAQHPEAWQRFLKEAQVTGQLEHPNIVPVYELARRPEDKQPFYCMRFVRGQTLRDAIAAYHERNKEGKAEPSELRRLLGAFVNVCQAISYAHARGVIHRDLKPDNIVLGGFGEVIVLDWGLARLLDEPTEESSAPRVQLDSQSPVEATQAGQLVGTPAYMAPEQAEGRLDLIDARTDTYGLGAILFEILTARPPHEGKDTAEVLRRVINRDSPRARTANPQASAALEAICAKAMAKSPAKRYAKASNIADEVQRWLADEPVTAYREPVSVRFGRWTRRHRTLVTGAAVLLMTAVAALSVGLVLISAEKQKTRNALEAESRALTAESRRRQQAEIERDKNSWMAEVFEGTFEDTLALEGCVFRVPPDVGSQLTVHKVLKRGEMKSAKRLAERPVVRAAVLEAIGNAYRSLGAYKDAAKNLHEALALREGNPDTDPDDIASSLHSLGALHHERGRLDEDDYLKAENYYSKALQIRSAFLESSSLPYCQTLFHQAWLAVELEEYDRAIALFERVIEIRSQAGVEGDRLVIRARMGLAGVQLERGGLLQYASALPKFIATMEDLLKVEKDENLTQALAWLKRGVSARLSYRAVPSSLLGVARSVLPGDPCKEAEMDLRNCLELVRAALGPKHHYEVGLLFFLAETLATCGKREDAEKTYQQCWDLLQATVGYQHHLAPVVAGRHAQLLNQVGKRHEAQKRFEDIIAAQKRRYGDDHYLVGNTLMIYSDLLRDWKEPGHQEAVCREALSIYEKTGGPRRRHYRYCLRSLAHALKSQGKLDEAKPLLKKLAGLSG